MPQSRLKAGTATLIIGKQTHSSPIKTGATAIDFEIQIEKGITTLETLLEYTSTDRAAHGAFYVSIQYLDTL